MKTKCITIAVLSTLLVAGFNASVASASLVTYHGMGLKDTVKIHADGVMADGMTVYAGQMLITYEGVDYEAYCADLDHYAGSSEAIEVNVYDLVNGDDLAYLCETFIEDVSTNLEAAALQVAIWELLVEDTGTFDATGGYFSISNNPDVASEANVLLAAVPDSFQGEARVTILDSADKQDFLIIPEAGTLILLAAFVPVLFGRRRRS